MIKREKIISLLLVLLMLFAASIIVNKTLFGHRIEKASSAEITGMSTLDAITTTADGTTIIHTSDLPGTINGYAGPIPLDIYISAGKIIDIKPLQNAETPPFFKRAQQLFSEWIGKSVSEAERIKVDAISGATYSSMAIINNVNIGLSCYDGGEATTSKSVPLKIWIALAVTLAACIVPLFVKNKIYHNVQLIANIAVLGFWSGQFLDYALILKYLSNGFIWPVGLVALVMLIAAFIYPLFGKSQYYCTHICPLGSAQQLMAQVCGYKIKISRNVLTWLDWFRKILWAALMLLLWADTLTDWLDLELFQAFQFESASWGIIMAAVAFVLISSIVTRPYCRFVCPTGSLLKRAENIG